MNRMNGLWVIPLVILCGCKTEHDIRTESVVEVKPMHITIDVNLKIDRALDDYFGDIDEAASKK